jgi:2-dehydropantoate 2-reductase
MTVAILGAGALGSYIGGRLAEAGAPVTLIARDAKRLDTIARNGLRIEDERGDRVVKVRAITADQRKNPVGVFFVLCKAMHTEAAIKSVEHLIGPETWAVTLQNGLGNEESLGKLLPPDRIGIGITDVPAGLIGPAHVRSPGRGTIRFWSLDGEDSAALRSIETMLVGAGFDCVASKDINTDVWEKCIFNAALNALGAITRRPNGGLDNADGRAIAEAVVDEGVAVATALAIPVQQARILAKIDGAVTKHRIHKGSMLQDVLAGRPTEIEHINGALVRAAEQAGLPAPVNRTLVHLMRLVQEAYG